MDVEARGHAEEIVANQMQDAVFEIYANGMVAEVVERLLHFVDVLGSHGGKEKTPGRGRRAM